MNELEKIERLLLHWMEHNTEHAKTYGDWSQKALSNGNRELSEVLERLCLETKKMDGLFAEALRAAGKRTAENQAAIPPPSSS